MNNKFYIRCNNQEEWTFVLNKYGELGYYWIGGDSANDKTLNKFEDLFIYKKRNGQDQKSIIISFHTYADDEKACSLVFNVPYNRDIIEASNLMVDTEIEQFRKWLNNND